MELQRLVHTSHTEYFQTDHGNALNLTPTVRAFQLLPTYSTWHILMLEYYTLLKLIISGLLIIHSLRNIANMLQHHRILVHTLQIFM